MTNCIHNSLLDRQFIFHAELSGLVLTQHMSKHHIVWPKFEESIDTCFQIYQRLKCTTRYRLAKDIHRMTRAHMSSLRDYCSLTTKRIITFIKAYIISVISKGYAWSIHVSPFTVLAKTTKNTSKGWSFTTGCVCLI